MAQIYGAPVANCRNCNHYIGDEHPYPHCLNCGNQLPAGIPRRGATASASHISASEDELAVIDRYRDAYAVANSTVRFGYVIKVIAVALGIGIILLSFILAGGAEADAYGERSPAFALIVMGIVVGFAIGIQIYVVGVLVMAQGQSALASLDGAVHTSPFLNVEQKAKVLDLPSTRGVQYLR